MCYIEKGFSVLFGTAGAKRTKNAEIVSLVATSEQGLRALGWAAAF